MADRAIVLPNITPINLTLPDDIQVQYNDPVRQLRQRMM